MANSRIEKGLTDSLGSNLSRLESIGELALDNVLDPGLLRDIPIIGMVMGISQTGIAIRDRIFVKKIVRFLTELKSVPEQERRDFVGKLLLDSSHRVDVGEKLLMIIDRLDDYQKAGIVGSLFRHAIKGRITMEEFYRLSVVVERAHLSDLLNLTNYAAKINALDPEAKSALFGLNLISINLKNVADPHRGQVIGRAVQFLVREDKKEKAKNQALNWQINSYGRLALEFIFPEIKQSN